MRKNTITEKERTSHWLKGYYVVQEIAEKLNRTYYKLTDYPRLLMRHELFKAYCFEKALQAYLFLLTHT